MSGAVDLSAVPNLPGYGFKRKQKNYHKPQTFNMVNGVRVEQQEGVTFERPKFVQVEKSGAGRRIGAQGESTAQEHFKDLQGKAHTRMPAWDALDRHVLRFYGYFKESVVETNLENYRVRQAVILFYLEDDTCHIIEKKQDNSGIPQGQMIRRHRFPGPNGGYLNWSDLQVGMELAIYGRTFFIFDCDPWTREYFSSQGLEQGFAQGPEQDTFGASRSQMQEVGPPGVPRTHEKNYREVQLGGGHINENMQQFMEWDRKVCRFFAVMDDLMTPQFERRPFMILYFLADDTVEIREQYPLNCGRDSFPIFYRRNKMSRNTTEVCGPLDQAKNKDDYIHITDFTVGQSQNLMNRDFFIYDADSFTREYFREELGFELGERVDVRLPERAVNRPRTPPYTGYGSWDDSMGSVYSLLPKAPKKDFGKLFGNDGKMLRFTAQLADAKVEDGDRLFVVNFDLADDTLSIHEPPQRNIGIVTGKFLEKGVHVNQMTGGIFKPEDLTIGATIKVYNRVFEIIGRDEYTRKHMEESGVPRNFDLGAVLEKLREGMRQQFPLVRDIFRKFDEDHDGVITKEEFKKALEKWAFQVSDEEALMVMKHFDARKDGQVSYNEFCDVLLDEDYTTDMMKKKPELKQEYDATYAQKATMRLDERAETNKVRNAVRSIGDVIYKHTQTFHKLFKEFSHMTHEDTVSCAQIQQALLQIGHDFDLQDVHRAVLFALPGVDPERVEYVGFLKAMVTCYHDLCAIR